MPELHLRELLSITGTESEAKRSICCCIVLCQSFDQADHALEAGTVDAGRTSALFLGEQNTGSTEATALMDCWTALQIFQP